MCSCETAEHGRGRSTEGLECFTRLKLLPSVFPPFLSRPEAGIPDLFLTSPCRRCHLSACIRPPGVLIWDLLITKKHIFVSASWLPPLASSSETRSQPPPSSAATAGPCGTETVLTAPAPQHTVPMHPAPCGFPVTASKTAAATSVAQGCQPCPSTQAPESRTLRNLFLVPWGLDVQAPGASSGPHLAEKGPGSSSSCCHPGPPETPLLPDPGARGPVGR